MSLLGLFGRRRQPSPVPAHVGSFPGKAGWWVLAQDYDRKLAGPFRDIGRANEVANAISSGRPWRWGPRD